MFKVLHRAVAFPALACACMLAGCNEAPPEGGKVESAATERKAAQPKLADVGTDMVAAVSSGKSSNVISVHFALRAQPTVNQALPVDVVIVPHRSFAMVRVRFESRDGLALTSGGEFGPKADVASEALLPHQLVLLPTRDGMFMMTASVETEGDDGNIIRFYSIPVIVGAGSAAPAVETPAAAKADPPASN